MKVLARWGVWLLLSGVLTPSFAHSGGVSYLTWQQPVTFDGKNSWARHGLLDLPLPEVATEADFDVDGDGLVRWREVLAAVPVVRTAIERRLSVLASHDLPNDPCSLAAQDGVRLIQRDTGPHLRVPVRLACSAATPRASLQLSAAAWLREVPDHAIYVAERDRPSAVTVLVGSRTTLPMFAPEGARNSAATVSQFAWLGVEHLLTGYDHLAFVALLLLGILRFEPRAVASMRLLALEAARVVSAFTAAHSLTLALAAGGWLRLPMAPVEAAIAGSIVVTALAVVLGIRALHGWRVAFAFGLVHGLGFASALAELLQGVGLAVPLLAFNVGLELAQLGVVLLALPVLWLLLRRTEWLLRATASSAAMLGMLGAIWLWQRL